MAVVTASNPSVDNVTNQVVPKISTGYPAGVDIPKCQAARIASDSTIQLSDGTAANDAASVHGIVGEDVNAGDYPALIGVGVVFNWDSSGSLTPGARYYLAAGGGVDSAPTVGDANGIFLAVSPSSLQLVGLI